MRKMNQKGFSAIEALLVIIILLLIGFIGYYVWHAQHETNKTYSSASKTAQSSPARKTVSDTTGTVVIKEWGVEAPYSGSLALSYAIGADTDSNSAAFSSKQLTAVSPECISKGGAITRFSGDADATSVGGSSGQTVTQYAASLSKSGYAHVGNYYYFFVHNQSACGDNPDATLSVQQQTNDAVKTLVPKLKAISN